jgi:hypothetical protein
VNLEKVSRDDWIVAALALLLAIDLLFLPWFSVSASIGTVTISASTTATGSPDGWIGVIAVLASLALIVDLAIERFSPQTQIPSVSGSRTTTRFMLAAVAAGFVALKFLLHIHFSLFDIGFYAAVVLAAALVYVTLQARQGSPLMARRSFGSRRGSGGPASTTPGSTTPRTRTRRATTPGGTAPGGPSAPAASPGDITPPSDRTGARPVAPAGDRTVARPVAPAGDRTVARPTTPPAREGGKPSE